MNYSNKSLEIFTNITDNKEHIQFKSSNGDLKYTYNLSSFPVSQVYDDTNEHTIKLSKNTSGLGVRTDLSSADKQITEFNSGKYLYELMPSCFHDCENLKDVVLQDNVKIINKGCFKNCKNLSSVVITSPFSIMDEAFRYTDIKSLELRMGNEQGIEDFNQDSGIEAFGKFDNSDIHNQSDILEKNEETGPYIGDYAFANCLELTDVKFKAATYISNNAFNNCRKLSSVTFSNHTYVMEDRVFANCKDLEEVKMPKRLDGIPNQLFRNCNKLKKVSFHSNTEYLTSIDDEIFYGCDELTSVAFPKMIQDFSLFSSKTFSGSKLKKITFNGIHSSYFNNFLNPDTLYQFYSVQDRINKGSQSSIYRQIDFWNGNLEDLKYGKIYGFNEELFKAVQEYNLPLIVLHTTGGCGGPTKTASFLTSKPFINLQKNAPYIFCCVSTYALHHLYKTDGFPNESYQFYLDSIGEVPNERFLMDDWWNKEKFSIDKKTGKIRSGIVLMEPKSYFQTLFKNRSTKEYHGVGMGMGGYGTDKYLIIKYHKKKNGEEYKYHSTWAHISGQCPSINAAYRGQKAYEDCKLETLYVNGKPAKESDRPLIPLVTRSGDELIDYHTLATMIMNEGFEDYEPDERFWGDFHYATEDPEPFEGFGAPNGCIFVSSDKKRYRWNKKTGLFEPLD